MIFELISAALSVLVLVLYVVWFVLRRKSGWPQLQRHYRARSAFNGYTWQVRSGKGFGLVQLNGNLTVGVNAEGIYLALIEGGTESLMFPLFIPWSEVSVASANSAAGPLIVFTFRQAPQAMLRVDEPFGREMLERARGVSAPT